MSCHSEFPLTLSVLCSRQARVLAEAQPENGQAAAGLGGQLSPGAASSLQDLSRKSASRGKDYRAIVVGSNLIWCTRVLENFQVPLGSCLALGV